MAGNNGEVLGDQIIDKEGTKTPESWRKLMSYVKDVCPDGTITVKMARGIPTELVEASPKIRFDKSGPLPIKLAKV
ncbi:MAG: hypothetical protein WC295_07340 [Methanoregula sp.]|jgi:hypothetical protein